LPEIIHPSIGIQAEPPVMVSDRVVKKRVTEALARAFLELLDTQVVLAALRRLESSHCRIKRG
jgi:ABC-type sulfate transport system substrate-binding protein